MAEKHDRIWALLLLRRHADRADNPAAQEAIGIISDDFDFSDDELDFRQYAVVAMRAKLKIANERLARLVYAAEGLLDAMADECAEPEGPRWTVLLGRLRAAADEAKAPVTKETKS